MPDRRDSAGLEPEGDRKGGDSDLAPALRRDTVAAGDWPLCRVRLMNDRRYPWLILVPRRPGATEIVDLAPADRTALMEEIARASDALRQVAPCDKLNVGSLGNLVPQLHIHVVARRRDDDAWPGPVWGSGPSVPYAGVEQGDLLASLASVFRTGAGR